MNKTTSKIFKVTNSKLKIGGMSALILSKEGQSDTKKAQILNVYILPGRGMNVFQIQAWVPGLGIFNLLKSPTLEEAANILNGGPADVFGNASFDMGGAVLLPFVNVLRGKLLPDNRNLEALIAGQKVVFPANFSGSKEGAEKHGMHGFFLNKKMDVVTTEANNEQASVTATYEAGNFGGQWLSGTTLSINAVLNSEGFSLTIIAKNSGNTILPIGIGWHPYFMIPSGMRSQVKLHVPSKLKVLDNNYDDVFPLGKLVPVSGTAYDFSDTDGALLNNLHLDECYTDLIRNSSDEVVVEFNDVVANYKLRVTAVSPEIKAFEIYSPSNANNIAIEPQFNLPDPYNPIWEDSINTNMVHLQPFDSVEYKVKVSLPSFPDSPI
jgi:aldose 1-epimerase